MKKFILPALTAVLFIGSAFVHFAPTADYKIKDGLSIDFKSKDPSGEFKTMKGSIKWDDANLGASKFDLAVDVASISTGNGMQNKKAQTAEWFDAAKYPTIKFVSTKIEKAGADYVITGNLTMKGVSKEKKITTKVAKSGTDLTFSGTFQVNRLDFKVGHKSENVSDVMTIKFSVPVAKK